MAVLPVVLYPDPRLVATNDPVEDFGAGLQELITNLKETCWNLPGLGLAAPQIGINLRLAFVDLSVGRDPAAITVLANPEIVRREGDVRLEEGCLSFPGLFVTIHRPERIAVRAQDQDAAWRELPASGTLAQAFCHEVDHLNGVLLPDHLNGFSKRLFALRVRWARRRWRRLPLARYAR